jgi:hypothetical protein
MNDRPTPLELIQIANDTLARAVLPGAAPEQLYPLRMIANSLGIAARELAAQDKDTADETRGLNLLYNDAKNFDDLKTRNRQFARDIRAGAFENNIAREAQLRQHLVIIARRKLAAAYPKGLQGNNN